MAETAPAVVSAVLEEIEAPGLDLLEIRNLTRGPDPGEVLAEPPPRMLVALLGDRPAVGVSQEALAVAESAPAFAMGEEVPHQCRRYGLPAYCLAFLAQPDQALFRVQVVRRQREGAAAAARGFHVQPQQGRVQGRSCPQPLAVSPR
jgi:hypothetical protein